MPVHSSVESDGRLYYQCGDTGKKYYFKMGNETARRAALKKAYAQCEAIEKSGYKEPTGIPRGELTSYGPVQSVLSEMRPPIQTQKRKYVPKPIQLKPRAAPKAKAKPKATPKAAITDVTLKSVVEDEFAAPKAKRARKQAVSGLIEPRRKYVPKPIQLKPRAKAKATPKSAITDVTLKSVVEDEFAAPKAKRARKQPVSGLIAPRRKFVSEAVKRKPKAPPKKVNAVKVESKDEKDELDIKRAESAKPISKRRKANAVANVERKVVKPKGVKIESKDEADELDIKRSRKAENVGKLKKDVALTVVPPVDTSIEEQVKEEATEALRPVFNQNVLGINQTPLPGNLPPLGIPFALLPRQAYTEWLKQGPSLQQPTSNALAPQSEWLRGGPSIETPQTDINARRGADPEPWTEGLKYDSVKGEWKFSQPQTKAPKAALKAAPAPWTPLNQQSALSIYDVHPDARANVQFKTQDLPAYTKYYEQNQQGQSQRY